MIKLNAKRRELPDWFTFTTRGNAYESKGDLDRAIQDFDEAIRLDPVGAVFIARGIAYASKGQYDRAIVDYSSAINSLDSEDIELLATLQKATALGNRGKAHMMKGEFVQAIRDFDEAIQLDPKGRDFIVARNRAIAAEAVRLSHPFKDAIKTLLEPE
jgi:tetratricopeptide (TPR) repeat protein